MQCPQCKSSEIIKNGKLQLRQRYSCKNCHYRFIQTAEKKNLEKKNVYERRAMHLLLEGLSIRQTAQLLTTAPSSIINWQKQWTEKIKKRYKNTAPELYSYSEIIHYIEAKRKMKGYSFLLLDLETDVSFICKPNALGH